MTEVEMYNVTLYDKDDQLFTFTVPQSQTMFNLSEQDVQLNVGENYNISVSAVNSVGPSIAAVRKFGK